MVRQSLQPTRRRVLASGAAVSAAAIAGCIGEDGGDGDGNGDDVADISEFQYDREEPDDGDRSDSLEFLQPAERDEDFDPVVSFDSYSMQVANLVFDGLYEWDDQLELEPKIADGMPEEEDDGETYIFEIQEGIEFHNGDEVTASDVAHSFTAPVEEETQNAATYGMIESAEAIDDYSLEVNLEFPYGPFTLSTMAVPVVPEEVRTEDREAFNTDPIGSGPFQFADFQAGEYVELERWDDYWDDPQPYVADIRFEAAPDDANRIAQVLAGDTDVIDTVPATEWDEVEGADGVRIHGSRSPSYMYLAFNCNEGETTDPDVRRAVGHSFSMREFVNEHLGPAADPLESPVPPITNESGNWDFPMDEWEGMMPEYDPDQAEQLLADAGVPDDWEPRIIAPEGGPREALAERIGSRLTEIGYGADVQGMSFATLVDTYNTGNVDDYEMYLLGWTGGPDPDVYYYNLFHESQEGVAQGHFYEGQGEFHDNILNARESADQEERRELYISVTEEILEYLPVLPAYTEHNTMAAREEVKDLHAHPSVSYNPRIVSDYQNTWIDE
ncbi:peptide/nickel transport system substrate-binding protein [Halobiforma haloterrestris]|uniref:Peptide/nickel transport system substrate-binding protein n=1 Tax=Natronobacterium haloterrestre TaxID=148448 RepID=A0A1I1HY90_NATHA|nr:ABC transporter substrate-binding protein [Halobiforma haloterrestris]SFC26413.1 peptide/nickel transport system substrate-binding protein [Halobiforma haloterrestris]